MNFLKQQKGSQVITQKFHNLERLVLAFFFLVLSLTIDENFIATNLICQRFIGFMSSYLPGIRMMSLNSDIPHITSLYLSLSYALMPFMTILFFYRRPSIEEYFIKTPLKTIIISFLALALGLFFIGYVSLQNETMAVFGKNYYHDERYFVAQILQTKIGLGIVIWYTIFVIPQGFGRWILMGFKMLRIFKLHSRE
ncbi:MAG: hypothetical protein PHW18_00710 [Sulfuricurvum sp.]|uniref:hypothetical protein n=1 Tax=Sulfuricurvum sp. TaxID=2025608 RepID=UPI0026050C0F|nr:hypothetical protein [Sulfuricurvum sp.]MDD2828073.1 hypothetical protein [Sulfuricurvum sp.]